MQIMEAIGVLNGNIDAETGRELAYEEIMDRSIDYLGGLSAIARYIPYSMVEVREAMKTDPYLNNLSIRVWDLAAGFKTFDQNAFRQQDRIAFVGGGIWNLYGRHGITSASCADGVCILKEAARRIAAQ